MQPKERTNALVSSTEESAPGKLYEVPYPCSRGSQVTRQCVFLKGVAATFADYCPFPGHSCLSLALLFPAMVLLCASPWAAWLCLTHPVRGRARVPTPGASFITGGVCKRKTRRVQEKGSPKSFSVSTKVRNLPNVRGENHLTIDNSPVLNLNLKRVQHHPGLR